MDIHAYVYIDIYTYDVYIHMIHICTSNPTLRPRHRDLRKAGIFVMEIIPNGGGFRKGIHPPKKWPKQSRE